MEVRKLILLTICTAVLFANGIIIKKSDNSVEMTVNKIQNIITKQGFTVYAVVDHQAGANKVRMELPASKEIIFGNPKIGTILMDLPLRILVFQGRDRRTKIAYRDGTWLGSEHNLSQKRVLNRMNFMLENITTEAGRIK